MPLTLTTLHTCAGRVAWNAAGDVIAYDHKDPLDPHDYFNVWTMTPAGTDRTRRSGERGVLFPPGHHGQPCWDPSDRWIVFQAQQEIVTGDDVPGSDVSWDVIGSPGCGMRNDLWAMPAADPASALRLYSPGIRGLLHPSFNAAGDKLLWSEYAGSGSSDLGHWLLKVADVRVRSTTIEVGAIRTYDPGAQPDWCEAHGFHPLDDRWVLFSGNPDGQSPEHSDIYWFHRGTSELVNLTHDRYWNEHAQVHPDGEHLIWARGCDPSVPLDVMRAEWWIMRRTGIGKEQLTFFNDPDHAHFLGEDRAVAADSSWHAAGRSFVGYVQTGSTAQGIIVRADDVALP